MKSPSPTKFISSGGIKSLVMETPKKPAHGRIIRRDADICRVMMFHTRSTRSSPTSFGLFNSAWRAKGQRHWRRFLRRSRILPGPLDGRPEQPAPRRPTGTEAATDDRLFSELAEERIHVQRD